MNCWQKHIFLKNVPATHFKQIIHQNNLPRESLFSFQKADYATGVKMNAGTSQGYQTAQVTTDSPLKGKHQKPTVKYHWAFHHTAVSR